MDTYNIEEASLSVPRTTDRVRGKRCARSRLKRVDKFSERRHTSEYVLTVIFILSIVTLALDMNSGAEEAIGKIVSSSDVQIITPLTYRCGNRYFYAIMSKYQAVELTRWTGSEMRVVCARQELERSLEVGCEFGHCPVCK